MAGRSVQIKPVYRLRSRMMLREFTQTFCPTDEKRPPAIAGVSVRNTVIYTTNLTDGMKGFGYSEKHLISSRIFVLMVEQGPAVTFAVYQ